MGKYIEDAKELLGYVGGKENIAAVSHCMTRMRFVLNNPKKADIAKIEAMKVVKGSFTQTGQFQVIIGNTVADFYNDFIAVSGIEGVSKDAVKNAAKQNQNVLQRMITALAEIFAPLIPAIITGGLILGFRNCIDSLYLFENGTKILCDISQFRAGIDSFLWLIGEAVFHMLPVGICWSVTKKMGTTQMLGIVLGLTLVSGQLLNAYAVAGTAAAAPHGTGHIKAGLNYAMSMHAIVDAHVQGFDENMYLDAATRTNVEETGGANFLFVTKDNKVVTPKSGSILPSITRRSLLYVAKEYLGLEVEEREVPFEEVKEFAECGLCGTAAVISPVGKIVDHGKEICLPAGMEAMGPVTQKLYDTLTGIQMGRIEAPEGWIHVIE